MWTKARTGNPRKPLRWGLSTSRGEGLSAEACPSHIARRISLYRDTQPPSVGFILQMLFPWYTLLSNRARLLIYDGCLVGHFCWRLQCFTYIIEIGFGRQTPHRARQTDTRPHRRESRKWPKYFRTFYREHDC